MHVSKSWISSFILVRKEMTIDVNRKNILTKIWMPILILVSKELDNNWTLMKAAAAGRLLIKLNQNHLVSRFSVGDKKISFTLIQMKTHSSISPPPFPHHTYLIQLLPLSCTGVRYRDLPWCTFTSIQT